MLGKSSYLRRTLQEEARIDKGWHLHFAWRPVRTVDDRYAWLKIIERKRAYRPSHRRPYSWNYRAL